MMMSLSLPVRTGLFPTSGGIGHTHWSLLMHALLKDVLPEWVINRPKRGFTPPIREWHQAVFSAHGVELEDGVL